ncbi:protein CHUP1 [Forsythia ovata]|uniref:Protein CHUP1 n=1 Tax=Forsythia ovata TaxID=205694 RepID=A0ABD1T9A7_9LAMI
MEGSTSKVEAMKPVLVKAGIPVAITVIGFIFAKIAGRKYLVPKAPSLSEIQENSLQTESQEMDKDDEQSFHNFDSASLPCVVEYDHAFTDAYYENSIETFHVQEIWGLRNRIQDLDLRFLRYQNLKEQEMVLMELQNKLLLEITTVEFFTREISLMESEIQRFEVMVIEYLKIMRVLEHLRSENVLLHKRVKKLLRRNKEQYHVLKKQNLQIVSKETEISRTQKEMEIKEICLKNMADEIKEMKMAIEQLQGEKNDLLSNLAEKSAATKIEGEERTLEDYNQLANEVEQLQMDRAAEIKELIYLRWCNACLRHELMRRNTEEEEELVENNHLNMNFSGSRETAEYGSDHELLSSSRLGHDDLCLGFTTGGHAQSKRRKLITKLKRWVEGSEKMKKKLDEKEKVENKGFRRLSVSEHVHQLPARKSCSSA